MYHSSYLDLCLVTHPCTGSFIDYLSHVEQAVRGGVTLIQLRNKIDSASEIRNQALALKEMLTPYHVPLIMNDYVELAKEVDADGVHLGQNDGDPEQARLFLGFKKIIGWSVESPEQLQAANQLSCLNYIGASAVFPSSHKDNCKRYWGIEGLKELHQQSTHPVVAIGGINLSNAAAIIAAGAQGIAVIGALHDVIDPYQKAQQLINEIQKGRAYV